MVRVSLKPRRLAALAVFALAAPVYLMTMNRTIGFVDRGELAAVATTLGIAHPTGYPTLTLLGHLATRLTPAPPVLALNALAALLTALGLAALAWLYDTILARVAPALGPPARVACSILAASIVGFGTIWWQQANGFEVHALQALLLPLAALAGGAWLTLGGARRAALAGFAIGLSFTNHGTTIHLLPALLALALLGDEPRLRLRELPAAAAGGIAGLLPLLYLPLRAAQHPRFSWSEPTTWARLWHHVSAEQYRGWMFSDAATWTHQARTIASLLPGELAYAGLALAAIGMWQLLRRERRIALAVALPFCSCILFAAGYAIRDVEAYLLVAVAALGACAAVGLAWLARRRPPALAWGAGVLLLAANLALHRRACDESGLTLVADLTRAQLRALPPRALLLSHQWDYTLSASYYLQAVEGVRPDVVVVSPTLLREPWYARELLRRSPETVARVWPQFEAFLGAAEDYEEGRAYDANRIRGAWDAFTGALLDSSLRDRPVYVTSGVALKALSGRLLVPEGLAYRVSADSAYREEPFAPLEVRPWRGRSDAYVATAAWMIASARMERARWETAHGHPERAEPLLLDAMRYDPGIDPTRVPPLALDGNRLVAQSAATFARLRQVVAADAP
jgi:hypothetical protein